MVDNKGRTSQGVANQVTKGLTRLEEEGQ